ncbi:MAG TPA: hypothetical protein VF892_10785, partial [Pseudonocardiaceae bacterium]
MRSRVGQSCQALVGGFPRGAECFGGVGALGGQFALEPFGLLFGDVACAFGFLPGVGEFGAHQLDLGAGVGGGLGGSFRRQFRCPHGG